MSKQTLISGRLTLHFCSPKIERITLQSSCSGGGRIKNCAKEWKWTLWWARATLTGDVRICFTPNQLCCRSPSGCIRKNVPVDHKCRCNTVIHTTVHQYWTDIYHLYFGFIYDVPLQAYMTQCGLCLNYDPTEKKKNICHIVGSLKKNLDFFFFN